MEQRSSSLAPHMALEALDLMRTAGHTAETRPRCQCCRFSDLLSMTP